MVLRLYHVLRMQVDEGRRDRWLGLLAQQK
jgi:hypothetical protein